jgi:hypothetical protein
MGGRQEVGRGTVLLGAVLNHGHGSRETRITAKEEG